MRRHLCSLALVGSLLATVAAGPAAADEPIEMWWPPRLPPTTVAELLAVPQPIAPSQLLTEADQEAKATRPATVVRRGPRTSGAVALTFDDGLDADACSRMADELRRSDAVGTFFINGLRLQQQPKKWRRILEGMEIGNHTRTHRDLTAEPQRVVVNQIRTNEYIHEQLLGVPMLKALRPPYGATNERVSRIAGELGYEHIVLWNVDTGDWRDEATAGSIVRRATGAPPGSIILMHCSREATAKALPRIIRHYQRRGIDMAGLSVVLEGAKGIASEDPLEAYGQP